MLSEGLSERPTEAESAAAPKRIVLVAAVATNGVIGNGDEIPWRIPEDLAHFKAVTMGHTLVMGRRTFDTIGRPLPGRVNIVITRQADWAHEGVLVAASLEDALAIAAEHPGDVMVMGGGQIYAAAFPHAHAQILTEVYAEPAGDVFYPAFDREDWVETRREGHDGYAFVWLARRA